MVCPKSELGERALFRKSVSIPRADSHGGTIINIIVAVIFFGLIALGILWIIKSFGELGEQYTGAVVETKYKAIAVKCQTNLRAIGQNIQIYATSNERFPPSLKALVEWSGNTQLFRCPAPAGEEYAYIPGQNGSMSPANVLLYEQKAIHNGHCSVLRLGGQLELLTPEELQQAVGRTLLIFYKRCGRGEKETTRLLFFQAIRSIVFK
ncbi:MAG: hypothetical protein ACYTFW_26515 [Planctomycetota bacterium]|jgi:hypothetical protein